MWMNFLPNGTGPKDVVLWYDGFGPSDRKTSVAAVESDITRGALIHGGQELIFNGTSSKVEFGDLDDLDFTEASSFTVCFWVKASESTKGYIISKFNIITGWSIYFNGTDNTFSLWYDGSLKKDSTNNITETTWLHLSMTQSGGAGTFYKNGVANGTFTEAAWTANTHIVTIGNRASGDHADTWFDGSLSQLVVFNKVLTQQQISQMYNKTK